MLIKTPHATISCEIMSMCVYGDHILSNYYE